jgi:hypothetical protein
MAYSCLAIQLWLVERDDDSLFPGDTTANLFGHHGTGQQQAHILFRNDPVTLDVLL